MAHPLHSMRVDQYRCDTCGELFSSQEALNEHRRTRHPARNSQHRCSACGQTFETDNELKEHMRMVHPERQRAWSPHGHLSAGLTSR